MLKGIERIELPNVVTGPSCEAAWKILAHLQFRGLSLRNERSCPLGGRESVDRACHSLSKSSEDR
jgi:hypothetical protein